MNPYRQPTRRCLSLESLEPRCLLSSGYGTAFAAYTDDTLATAGLVGSYVDESLRAVDEFDWRSTQTISGTRVEHPFFSGPSLGNRAEVGVTGGSDNDWHDFSVQWDGAVQILENGTTLITRSDDGSRMWIDLDQSGSFEADELVDANWGSGGGLRVSDPTPALAIGMYDVRIQFEEEGSPNQFSLIANPIQEIRGFAIYTNATLTTPGLTGSYVDARLGSVDELDWRPTQTIAGTRVDAVDFTDPSWGARSDVGLTGGSDANWDNFSVQWDGVVEVVDRGVTIATRSDDGSRMWIDINQNGAFEATELVDNNWGFGQATTTGPFSSPLEEGVYSIRIQYEEGAGGNVIQLVPRAPHIVRVGYLMPVNRTSQVSAVANLQDLLTRMQSWYREQMDRNGFGPKTFRFETEADGVTPKIHLVGMGVDDAFLRQNIWENSNAAATAAGVKIFSSGEVWMLFPEAHIQNPDGSISGGTALGAGFGSGDSGGVAMGGSDFLFRSAGELLSDDRSYAGMVIPEIGPLPLVQGVSFPSFERSTLSSIASAAQGAMAHELGHAFGLSHDGRNDVNYHGNLMGNGLRGLRGHAHPALYPEDDMRLAYATALALNESRYFNQGVEYTDNTAPTLAIQTSGATTTENGLLEIDFTASDSSEIALALLRHSGETIGEMALSGTSASGTFATTFFDNTGANAEYFISLYDSAGNRTDASTTINLTPPANRPPRPEFAAFHSTALVGNTITLDASNTSDPDDSTALIAIEWDLDGDGSFETAPTVNKILTTTFSAGTHLVRARATDPSGNQAISAPIALRVHPLGDFDLDNGLGSSDLALLQRAIADSSPDPQFDLTGDTLLNQRDVDFWLNLQAGSRSADFDQDADVDGRDFLAWQRGFGLSSDAQPADGDADGDRDVDGDDLATWLSQFGGVTAVAATTAPSAINTWIAAPLLARTTPPTRAAYVDQEQPSTTDAKSDNTMVVDARVRIVARDRAFGETATIRQQRAAKPSPDDAAWTAEILDRVLTAPVFD